MAIGMLRVAAELLGTCSRRVSRAARKIQLHGAHMLTSSRPLFSRRVSRAARKIQLHGAHMLTSSRPLFSRRVSHVIPFLGKRRRKTSEELTDEEEIWRKGIILGEKCKPLDFSGAIYYDLDGQLLAGMPRSPMRSPIRAFLDDGKLWK